VLPVAPGTPGGFFIEVFPIKGIDFNYSCSNGIDARLDGAIRSALQLIGIV
jgi:hypothetical protein